MDEFWPEVKDSRWIKVIAEAWEPFVYRLDGYIVGLAVSGIQ